MFWFLLVLAIILGAVAIHGIATGTVWTKYSSVDVKRAEKPFLFWFLCSTYLLLATYLSWLAFNDYRLLH